MRVLCGFLLRAPRSIGIMTHPDLPNRAEKTPQIRFWPWFGCALPEIKENAVLGIWIVCLRIGAGKGFRILRGLIAPALMLVTAAGMAQQASGAPTAKAEVMADAGPGPAPAVAPEAVLSHEPGTVIGTVKDANGNVIEGAAVTLRAVASDARSAATADANGFFHFSVEPGEYVATVSSPGLTTW